jgi:hypothetical protein
MLTTNSLINRLGYNKKNRLQYSYSRLSCSTNTLLVHKNKLVIKHIQLYITVLIHFACQDLFR